jgi:hypothetical protein
VERFFQSESADDPMLAALRTADLLGFGEPATATRMSADGSIWAAP